MPADLVFLHGRHTRRCRARVDKRFVGYHTLQLATEGAVELFYDQQRHLLDRPTWWAAWPGPHIRFHAAPGHGGWEHRYIAFRGPLVRQWQAERLLLQAPQPATDATGAAGRFDALYRLIERGDRLSHRGAVNLLERVLIDLAEQRRAQRVEPTWLRQARRLLEDQPTFSPDYQAVARELGMGLSTLRRRFRGATGMTLHEYLVGRRIDRAKHRLVDTDTPIKQIADDLSYRDVFYFARQFRQVLGVPPAAYRRSRQR